MSSSGQVSYRPYNPATDRTSAMAMMDTYLGPGYGASIDKYASDSLVAIGGGSVVGVLVSHVFTFQLEPGETPMTELLSIAVLPNWRRKGVAPGLEQAFANANQGRILMASGVPAAAANFYSRQGYRNVSVSRWEKQPRGRTSQRASGGQQRSASSLSRSRHRRAGA